MLPTKSPHFGRMEFIMTYIDIITGFLESGKTTFINKLMNSSLFDQYKKVVLIVCEEGISEYESMLLEKRNIHKVVIEDESELNDNLIYRIKKEYNPDYVIVEYNGTWDIANLIGLRLPFGLKIRNILSIHKAGTFHYYLSNMASLLQPHILNSDIVLVNEGEKLTKEKKVKLIRDIKNINSKIDVSFLDDSFNSDKIDNYFAPFEKYYKITPGLISIMVLLLVLCFIPLPNLERLYDFTKSISVVFLSVLIQAIPFILIGAFVSAIIQVLVPTGWILNKMASKNTPLSFCIAAIGGIFVPICDCGLVPIITSLLKRNTPLPQTITFWLTSAAVNPIVVLSIVYAFPGQPKLVLIRIFAGLFIGLFIGVLLKIAKINTKDVLRENVSITSVGADMISIRKEGTLGKLDVIIQVAKIEFFRVTKYVIIGGLLTALLQSLLSQTMRSLIATNFGIQLLIMIAAAILMSTCSTSNAFIGRSFSSYFSSMSVMSYIVLGPMLDFKNMLLLSSVLKKGFLLKPVFMVVVVGYFIFTLLAKLI